MDYQEKTSIAQSIIDSEGGADKINARMDVGNFDAGTVARLIRDGVERGYEEGLRDK